ncbi:MAG: TraR/DksA C4-type zinc finger protein [Rhodocyclaceae bacterium]|nr:TraR/DksA C4-type zinc finger protein [Rhodocyclaceae bacterium]
MLYPSYSPASALKHEAANGLASNFIVDRLGAVPMSDLIDTANQAAEFIRDADLANELASHAMPPQHIVDGIVHCSDCDAVIDAARLTAKPDCIRCIGCQEAFEKEVKKWK